MRSVNIHEAKTHLSKLVEAASKGDSFIIARAGKPMVKVTPIDEPPTRSLSRIGFMEGQVQIPDDFDTMFAREIEELFYGEIEEEPRAEPDRPAGGEPPRDVP